MRELNRIAVNEGFYLKGDHWVRTDLECAIPNEIIIAPVRGGILIQVPDTTQVEPDMKPFVTEVA